MSMRVLGSLNYPQMQMADKAVFHSKNVYMAVMDNPSMWDPATLDLIVDDFPKNVVTCADLYLLLAECVSNAAVHAKAEMLVFYVRRRKKVILLSFYQNPPMTEEVAHILEQARDGTLPEFDFEAPGGLGFPILVRLAYQVTISLDRTRLQLWLRC